MKSKNINQENDKDLKMKVRGLTRYSSSNNNSNNVNVSNTISGVEVVYRGSIYNPNLMEQLTNNMKIFLNSLDDKGKGESFGLMPMASMAGVGGLYVRNLSTLHHYYPGTNYKEYLDYSKVLHALLLRANLKYDVSNRVTLMIKYYPSKISKSMSRQMFKDRRHLIYKKYNIFNENQDYLINVHKKFLRSGNHVNLGPYNLLTKYNSTISDLDNSRKIIVMDLETYIDEGNLYNVYAAGFRADGVEKIYYITDYKNGKVMLHTFLNNLMEIAGKRTTIFAHNWAKFDGVMMLSNLLDWCISNRAVIEPIITSTEIKSITITTKDKKIIKFHDSYLMLSAGLGNLSNAFNLPVVKGKFPHKFVTKERLNYIGPKPDIKYYNPIAKEEYSKIPNEWNLKSECLSYLKKDLLCLYNVITYFREYIMKEYGLDTGKVTTMPSLALKIFRKHFYEINENVRIITHRVYQIIKHAFIGGRAEVYKPFGENLFLYDINSLYPYAMTKPMPVGVPTYIGFKESIPFEKIKNKMGFAIVDVKVPNGINRPLLPVNVHGRNYCPTGKWTGIYFIPELKDLSTRGYQFKVHGYFKFETSKNLFKKYVRKHYKLKTKAPSEVERFIHKLMLNSLFGRFGMLDQHTLTRIVSRKDFQKIIDLFNVDNYVELCGGNYFLVSYDPSRLLSILDGDNNKQEIMDRKFRLRLSPNIQSIPIAAAITSYARIQMNKVLGDKEIKVYYTDTDSVVVNKPLPRELVSPTVLGKFKLEQSEIQRGMFILPKVYNLVLRDGSYKTKFKGIKEMKEQELGIYEEIISGKIDRFIHEEERMYKDIWELKGLKMSKIKMNVNMNLTTRKKIINKKGMWINTKPLSYRYILKNKGNNNNRDKGKDKNEK